MNTFPMRQQDATLAQPFYSVCYQWHSNPWTLYSHHRYQGPQGRTQHGTSNLEVAKAQADQLVRQSGICYAQVSKTLDCYSHNKVYEARAATGGAQ